MGCLPHCFKQLKRGIKHLKQVGCDPADHKKWGGACAATCIEVVPNVVRVIQGGLHPLHPTAPVQPFLRWQPGLCNEERHSTVSVAVCLPMVCKTSTAVCHVSEQFGGLQSF